MRPEPNRRPLIATGLLREDILANVDLAPSQQVAIENNTRVKNPRAVLGVGPPFNNSVIQLILPSLWPWFPQGRAGEERGKTVLLLWVSQEGECLGSARAHLTVSLGSSLQFLPSTVY
ncbi:hypothetical protein EYF80_018220 [Liparis tanakae]|uniref:Uncharacterized protein n=1 Tax=Liparis tanakae TaxID=230148 RepID=A0A4Z2I2J6_9TELE|nr:hypothetical protein EYF80_018220 [Liparis tanakae]